ncbi:MAG: inosine/xanthosine triphosphatase [Acidobacteria bacterium]|nr:MAG: inosine/xanthosine triphosphatase [Acidobacteriota bacterium]
MMHVIVGSTNEGKIAACRRAFERAFGVVEVQGVAVPSGVPAQPVGEECFNGARNRGIGAREASRKNHLSGDYFVGIEGGILLLCDTWFGFSVTCVIDGRGRTGYGTSPLFELPRSFMLRALAGGELGDVVRELTGDKHFAERRGAVGLLTNGLLTREAAHESGVLAALAPHLSAGRYEL